MDKARKGCNFQGGMASCPMSGNCLDKSKIYSAEVKTSMENMHIYTLTKAKTMVTLIKTRLISSMISSIYFYFYTIYFHSYMSFLSQTKPNSVATIMILNFKFLNG